MNRSDNFKKFNIKSKKKVLSNVNRDEEMVSFKELREERQKKHYRNYDNALRSKDLDKLLSYEDD